MRGAAVRHQYVELVLQPIQLGRVLRPMSLLLWNADLQLQGGMRQQRLHQWPR